MEALQGSESRDMRSIAASFALLAAATIGAPASAQDAEVAYPEGYRGWTHVKSMVIRPGHELYDSFGGIHHVYANDQARAGYEDHDFPDGSVIVFDLLEARTEETAITEGARKVLGVMVKDAERFPETGGWGFEGFAEGDPEKRAVEDAATACFECHTSQAERDYVFSDYRR